MWLTNYGWQCEEKTAKTTVIFFYGMCQKWKHLLLQMMSQADTKKNMFIIFWKKKTTVASIQGWLYVPKRENNHCNQASQNDWGNLKNVV